MIFDDDRDYVRFIPGRWAALGVSRRTWSRWLSGQTRIPEAVVRLARLLVAGEVGELGTAWAGWKMLHGQLYDPEGVGHTPASVQAWHWTKENLVEQRGRENLAAPEVLPQNVHPLPAFRRAHVLTDDAHARLARPPKGGPKG